MSYTPTTWTTGDTITASAMNKIENGIASAGASMFVITGTSDGAGGFTTNKTYTEAVTAFNAGSLVYLDLTNVTGWDKKCLMVAYRTDAYEISLGFIGELLPAWADSADGYLYWAD